MPPVVTFPDFGAIPIVVYTSFPAPSNPFAYYPVSLSHPTAVLAAVQAGASGDTDLYTCPSGRQAVIVAITGYNPTGGTINYWPQVKLAGTYYLTKTSAAVVTVSNFNASSICPVLSAGQIFSIHCSALGLQFVAKIVEFDAHADLKSVTLTALSAGDNVLYTCPANRTAIVFDALPSVQSAAGQIGYTNQSGGARTVLGKIGSTQFGPSVAPATATATTITCPSALAAGEILKVNVDANTATQLFWVTLTEVDVANNG